MGNLAQYVFLLLCVFASNSILPSQCTGKNAFDDYFSKIQKTFEKYSANLTEELLTGPQVSKIGATFDCPSSVSPTVPKSVHLLRPGDIKVMGAIGDSLTAAYAAGAGSFTPVMFEYPGESASIGGDKTLEEVVTLPNIFRKYNSHLYGYSTGISIVFTQPFNKKLNLAISGSYASDMPNQARDLINKMKNDPTVDFENDWKLITLFIGGNDLCSGCLDADSSPEKYLEFLEKTIQIFHDQSPRTFLNVVGIMQTNLIVGMRGPLICNLLISVECPCALGGSIPEHFMYLKAREFQRVLRTSIQSGKYDDKDDFAAVYQPFLEDSDIPRLPNGSVDRTYFAPDCFHLSQKGQSAQSTANWNNLFEPVGSKDTSYVPGEVINCPSQDFPYLYTNINSKPGFLATIHGTSEKANQLIKNNTIVSSRYSSSNEVNVIVP